MTTVSCARAALACMLAFAASAQAEEQPKPDWTNTGNASLVSDYVFRGVTQTQGKPTGQFTLDFTHVSGAYLGTFGSGVSHAAYNNGSGSEIDLYGGYRHTLAEDTNIDVGVVTYWYAGAHYDAAGHDVKYHTYDFKLGFNKGPFNVTGWYTFSPHWFGFALDPATNTFTKTNGTTYFEANWNPEISKELVANLHIGHQSVRHLSDFNFVDVKLGLTYTSGVWAFSAAATHNNGSPMRNGLPYWTWFNADGSSKNVVGSRVILSVARNF